MFNFLIFILDEKESDETNCTETSVRASFETKTGWILRWSPEFQNSCPVILPFWNSENEVEDEPLQFKFAKFNDPDETYDPTLDASQCSENWKKHFFVRKLCTGQKNEKWVQKKSVGFLKNANANPDCSGQTVITNVVLIVVIQADCVDL